MNDIPAFPMCNEKQYQEGMTLRDYFAAKAMQGLLSSTEYGSCPANKISVFSYQQADAMLEARQEKEVENG